MRASSRPHERGFILPTTMLVVVLLTVMLSAAFMMISAEYRTTDNAFASSRSLAIAQAGLETFFADTVGVVGKTQVTVTYPFIGGYARVTARQLRDSIVDVAPALWIVQATGYDTVRAAAGQPNGKRAVAQFAELRPGSLPSRAAMVAANGVKMSASDGTPPAANPISGVSTRFSATTYNPSCTVPPAQPALPVSGTVYSDTFGLAVPTGGYSGTGGNFPGGRGVNGTNTLATSGAVNDSTNIAWSRLLAGEFTPDYVNQLPPAGNNTYLSYYYDGNVNHGDVTIPSGSRRGLLVAKGDVTLGSGAHWDGIIVAGGKLDGNGNFSYTVHGMVITGLNMTLGQNPGDNQIKRGSGRVIQWDFCYAHSAFNALSHLVPIRNAWVDTWSTY